MHGCGRASGETHTVPHRDGFAVGRWGDGLGAGVRYQHGFSYERALAASFGATNSTEPGPRVCMTCGRWALLLAQASVIISVSPSANTVVFCVTRNSKINITA